MITRSDLDKMKIVLQIDNVEYTKLGDEAEVTLSFYITTPSTLGGQRHEGGSFSVVIKASEDEIQKLKEKVEENRAEVSRVLEEIKAKFKSLSILGSPVTMSLEEIVNELLKVVKKGFDIKEEHS